MTISLQQILNDIRTFGEAAVTQLFGDLASEGSSETLARADHKHGMPADPLISSKVLGFFRSAAAGAGDQSVTGVGFKPRAIIAIGTEEPATDSHSVGFGDVNLTDITLANGDLSFADVNNTLISMINGADQMRCGLKSFDSDGFTVTWVKDNAGLDFEGFAICIR